MVSKRELLRHRLDTKRRGFTLSELLLAAVILVVALCALLAEFLACTFLNESSRNLTRATNHAQHVMEEIKDTNFSQVKSKIDSGDWDWDSEEVELQGLNTLTNESIDTQANGTDLLDIAVTVSWQDRGGRDRGISLETQLVEP